MTKHGESRLSKTYKIALYLQRCRFLGFSEKSSALFYEERKFVPLPAPADIISP